MTALSVAPVRFDVAIQARWIRAVSRLEFAGFAGAALLVVVLPFPGVQAVPTIACLVALGLQSIATHFLARQLAVRPGGVFALVSFSVVPITALLYFLGVGASPFGAMVYIVVAAIIAFYYGRKHIVATVGLHGLSYALVLTLQRGNSQPVSRWLVVMAAIATTATVVAVLAETVFGLQSELEAVNSRLETRVNEQVSEVERLGRLRRFLPPAVAAAVLNADDETLLAAHRKEIAVVFIDLRGFSRFTGEAEPEEVIEALRSYHRSVGTVMDRYEATVGPLEGDGMMAYFNDPLPCDDPPRRATEMALALREPLDAFAAVWEARGYALSYGIGIAFGYATLGVMGFEGRQEYAPVGTVANLASRLCSHAGPGQILMDRRTYASVSSAIDAASLEPIDVKGFPQPVQVVAIEGMRN